MLAMSRMTQFLFIASNSFSLRSRGATEPTEMLMWTGEWSIFKENLVGDMTQATKFWHVNGSQEYLDSSSINPGP